VDIFDQDNSNQTLFAEVLLPVPIPKLFTYRIPLSLNDHVKVGQRAIVQFGDRKILTGIIVQLESNLKKDYEVKSILELLDEYPVVNDLQLNLFQWIANYYMCTPGEVMNAALPSGLKLSSESMVQLHPAFLFDESDYPFSEKEIILLTRLKNESITYTEVSKILGQKNIYAILKSLVSKEAIILFEEVKEKYRPKVEKKIRLTNKYNSTAALEQLFETLSSKPKQEAVLLKYLQEVPIMHDLSLNKNGLAKKILQNEEYGSSINSLLKKSIFEEFETIIPRFEIEDNKEPHVILLSEEQEQAQREILKSFESQDITLLHGITGSGKTELYINMIRKALDSDAQVLYLLPEIALTTQIVQRLKKVFGSAMGVYHSKFSDNERVEVWNGILTGRFKFVVGVRSSIFLPFDNLGLIIVDEEHDSSYKQQEPAPRYHARDVAMVMAQMHHAKVLLGSATPSVETYHHALQKKYGLVKLDKRFGNAQLPKVVLADMSKERITKTLKGEFSSLLLKSIEEALKQKEQVIIFQNRRGYSPMVNCEDCGWVPKCVNCAVSLTYHQFRNALICHYCGYKESLPHNCPTCTSTRLKTVGYGTEKLEEELKLYFSEASIQRMDLDTTRSKNGYENIISQFEKGETNILVGTQMVTKGLDFDKVSLVGVFNADRMMHFPDFRSYERAYQLIMQVSGRAGRREKPGNVVIQTSSPDHEVLSFILKNNFDDFYRSQILDRQQHAYPPFTRLIEITTKHIDKKTCRETAILLANYLSEQVKEVLTLGPGEPIISKIRNQYLMTILIKVKRGSHDLQAIKNKIQNTINNIITDKKLKNTKFVVDVDPV
jgi:primosomal protein N' (replication factor Y) (superfamily II helicase)